MSVPPEPTINEGEAQELIVVATDIVTAVDNLREEIGRLKKRGAGYRRLFRIVIGSLIFDFLLSVGLAFLLARTNTAANEAQRASSAQVVACLAGNETRRIQTELWNTVLASPPPIGDTPERMAQRETQIRQFREYIAVAFAPQECDK